MAKKQAELVEVKRNDLVMAWSLLENMTVSLDQIFGAYAHGIDEKGEWVDKDSYHALCKALYEYCLKICEQTSQARMRLLAYLPPEEAEYLSEYEIPYWNYDKVTHP